MNFNMIKNLTIIINITVDITYLQYVKYVYADNFMGKSGMHVLLL